MICFGGQFLKLLLDCILTWLVLFTSLFSSLLDSHEEKELVHACQRPLSYGDGSSDQYL